jgi:hypothetical protein
MFHHGVREEHEVQKYKTSESFVAFVRFVVGSYFCVEISLTGRRFAILNDSGDITNIGAQHWSEKKVKIYAAKISIAPVKSLPAAAGLSGAKFETVVCRD